jgi:tetratricopeptide (TPR) repeat protein
MAAFQEALRIKPNLAQAHYYLGGLFRDLGRLDEARASLEKAISIKPDLAESHYLLVELKRYRDHDDHVHTLEHLLDQSDTDNEKKCIFILPWAKSMKI